MKVAVPARGPACHPLHLTHFSPSGDTGGEIDGLAEAEHLIRGAQSVIMVEVLHAEPVQILKEVRYVSVFFASESYFFPAIYYLLNPGHVLL